MFWKKKNNGDIKAFGNLGEDKAADFLKKQGYEIISRNFRIRSGELDIVAKDGEELVFVEVKTRVLNDMDFLPSVVNRSKMSKVKKTAEYFMVKKKYVDCIGRFDVIFVIDKNGKTEIDHLKNAFSL